MGLFDFFKPKKNELKDNLAHIFNSYFPKGEKDINAGTDELLFILNNKISRYEAKNIFIKSVTLSRIAEKFDKGRLKVHLSRYCLHYFNENQINKFYDYLVALSAAMMSHRRTPSEVIKKGDDYRW